FSWGPFAAASMLFVTGLVSIIIQMFVVGRVVKAVGERGALLIGLGGAGTAFVRYSLASTPSWFFARISVRAPSALILPGLQSLMSRRVSATEQGRLQGVNSGFMGVCAIVGPMIYLSTLEFAVRHDPTLHQPGLPIMIAATFCATALVLSLLWAK